MKINPDMNLAALARHMEWNPVGLARDPGYKVAAHMRDILVASGYADTGEIPADEFLDMRYDAFERAARS